jgi:hypothetical protein
MSTTISDQVLMASTVLRRFIADKYATDAMAETMEPMEDTFTIWALTTIYYIVTKFTWWTPLIIGVPGNIICIMITFKKTNRHISSCSYMSALAIADTMTLVSVSWALTLIHWGFSSTLPVQTREFLYR